MRKIEGRLAFLDSDHRQERGIGRVQRGPIGAVPRHDLDRRSVTRTALSRTLTGHAAISPDMALRLEAWLGPERGGRAELWLGQQMVYDVWQARQKARPQIARLVGR